MREVHIACPLGGLSSLHRRLFVSAKLVRSRERLVLLSFGNEMVECAAGDFTTCVA